MEISTGDQEKLAKSRFLNTENYLRVRPKTAANIAFYAPAADITMGLKPVLSSSLTIFNESANPNLKEFVMRMAGFMKGAALSGQTWEKEGLGMLEDLFKDITPEERGRFLMTFFYSVMDFYWHAMRMSTDCPEIKPEEMQKALEISFAIRSMPVDMREKYLEHLRTYNLLPQIFDQTGMFDYTGEVK
jgi:hypothetical protein